MAPYKARDKTIADKLMCIPYDNTQNYYSVDYYSNGNV